MDATLWIILEHARIESPNIKKYINPCGIKEFKHDKNKLKDLIFL